MLPFAVIPVIDLKGGIVVHARAGERSRYLPLRTPLAASSDADAVVDGLLALAPFRQLYIADLDAIEGRGAHRDAIAALRRRYPQLELWVDAGIAEADTAVALAASGVLPVIGSESLASPEILSAMIAALGTRNCVLSLDYRGAEFIGPPALETAPGSWPDRVILMTLARVGTGTGPDLARLAGLRARAGTRRIFAAGGVRDRADLEKLAALGIAGALVATALHDGRLGAASLAEFNAAR